MVVYFVMILLEKTERSRHAFVPFLLLFWICFYNFLSWICSIMVVYKGCNSPRDFLFLALGSRQYFSDTLMLSTSCCALRTVVSSVLRSGLPGRS